MRTRARDDRWSLHKGAALAAMFLLICAPLRAQDRLTVKGHVSVPLGTDAVTQAYLVDGQGVTMPVALSRSGAFRVNMPADDRYVLRFETQGCVTKEVVIDAVHANDAKPGRERTVRFDVALHGQGADGSERYAGAVGRIGFERGTSVMHVQQRYELVRVSQLLADAP